MTRSNHPRRWARRNGALLAALALPALLAAASVSAKTLVFCSEGSPENFYPGINTTGTSFVASQGCAGASMDRWRSRSSTTGL